MKALVVGIGSIAKRHIRNLKHIQPDSQIAILHRRHPMLEEIPASIEQLFTNLEEAVAWGPEFAIIATPAPFHIETATQLATHGIHLLIEKPLAIRLEGIQALIDLCHRNGLVLVVGYNLRFSESLREFKRGLDNGIVGQPLSVRAEVGQYLPDWRPNTDYRKSVSAQAATGGGATLELSHEIDYLRWLFGEVRVVSAHLAKLSQLEIDVEDTAEITLRFINGILANIHLDMLQRVPVRRCHIIGTDGTLMWDLRANAVKLLSPAGERELYAQLPLDANGMYIAEIKHFLECIRTGSEPLITGRDGIQVLRIVLAAKQSSQEQRFVAMKDIP